jgi:hypothetical protein
MYGLKPVPFKGKVFAAVRFVRTTNPQGRLKIDGNAILDNLQSSLRDLIMSNDVT